MENQVQVSLCTLLLLLFHACASICGLYGMVWPSKYTFPGSRTACACCGENN